MASRRRQQNSVLSAVCKFVAVSVREPFRFCFTADLPFIRVHLSSSWKIIGAVFLVCTDALCDTSIRIKSMPVFPSPNQIGSSVALSATGTTFEKSKKTMNCYFLLSMRCDLSNFYSHSLLSWLVHSKILFFRRTFQQLCQYSLSLASIQFFQ